jgi:hypothetical protein
MHTRPVDHLTTQEIHERHQAWIYFGVLCFAIALVIAAMIYALVG